MSITKAVVAPASFGRVYHLTTVATLAIFRRMNEGRARLLQWLERSKLSQAEAAKIIVIHRAYLNHIVTGDRVPGLDIAVKIERATGIPVEAWLSTSDAKTAEPDSGAPVPSNVAKA